MGDESNDLLRQILKAQQELLSEYKNETERAGAFRITAVEMQKSAQRKGLIAALMVIGGGIIILLGMIANR